MILHEFACSGLALFPLRTDCLNLGQGDPCRSVAGDVPSAEVNFHKLGCSGFFSSEVCLGLGPDGAKFGSINEWRLL